MRKTKAKEIIQAHRAGFARPREVETFYECNGLAVGRAVGTTNWGCFHLPTGLEIYVRIGRRTLKRDVIAFVSRIAPLYPWTEWKKRSESPAWAGEAYKKVQEIAFQISLEKTQQEDGALHG